MHQLIDRLGTNGAVVSLAQLVACDCVNASTFHALNPSHFVRLNGVFHQELVYTTGSNTMIAQIYLGSAGPSPQAMGSIDQILSSATTSLRPAPPAVDLVPSPSFTQEDHWFYLPSAVSPAGEDVAMTWLSTAPFALQDLRGTSSTHGLPAPFASLDNLSSDDVFIMAAADPGASSEAPTPVIPAAKLPLKLADADVRAEWEGQVAPNIPEYVLWRTVDGVRLDVRVYFGTQDPSPATLARAQAMLGGMNNPS